MFSIKVKSDTDGNTNVILSSPKVMLSTDSVRVEVKNPISFFSFANSFSRSSIITKKKIIPKTKIRFALKSLYLKKGKLLIFL